MHESFEQNKRTTWHRLGQSLSSVSTPANAESFLANHPLFHHNPHNLPPLSRPPIHFVFFLLQPPALECASSQTYSYSLLSPIQRQRYCYGQPRVRVVARFIPLGRSATLAPPTHGLLFQGTRTIPSYSVRCIRSSHTLLLNCLPCHIPYILNSSLSALLTQSIL